MFLSTWAGILGNVCWVMYWWPSFPLFQNYWLLSQLCSRTSQLLKYTTFESNWFSLKTQTKDFRGSEGRRLIKWNKQSGKQYTLGPLDIQIFTKFHVSEAVFTLKWLQDQSTYDVGNIGIIYNRINQIPCSVGRNQSSNKNPSFNIILYSKTIEVLKTSK